MKPDHLSPSGQLMRLILGKWSAKPIYAAAELGLADMLAEGPKSIAELAQESRTHGPTLYRVMRALASLGIFSETEEGLFALTPLAEGLKTGALRSVALVFNSGWNDQAWGCLLDSLKTGAPAFETAHGMPLTAWLERNPRAAEVFNQANAVKAAGLPRAILEAYDFSEIETLADVGGGLGVLTAEILLANPAMKGIVADLPAVIREARKTIRARGLEGRCRAVEVDFFKEIPSGAEAYLLSNILHDWPDEACRRILANCRRAMKKDSRLLILEMVVPPGNEPSVAKLLDLEMLVITGGRERTEEEFKELLAWSGFRLSRIIPTREGIWLMEGVRA